MALNLRRKLLANAVPFLFTVEHKPTIDESEAVYEQVVANVAPMPVSDIIGM